MNGIALVYESEQDIIRDYCETGSQRSATAFVRKHQKFVYATALRYLQNHEDADDAAQETFIKALKSLNKFKGNSSVKTWLYRITTNVCINTIRKKKLLSIFSRKSENEYVDLLKDELTPEQAFQNKEFEENFVKLLGKLPEKQRETFALRYFENLQYEQISQMLGTTVGGLKANYYQAVKKLSTMMK